MYMYVCIYVFVCLGTCIYIVSFPVSPPAASHHSFGLALSCIANEPNREAWEAA